MTRPAPISDLTVVVPANDEEETLFDCLTSVEIAIAQARRSHPHVRSRIVVVLDRCSDDSAAIAESFVEVIVVRLNAGNVGAARAHGIAVGLGSSTSPASLSWLANTDADSTVPPHWLSVQLEHADADADVWVGTVAPVLGDLDDERRHQWLRTHPPGASIGHVHGANLGIRRSAYDAVGGFEAIPEHEDVGIVERLRASGAAITASDAANVLTSSRLVGRTPRGYAGFLADLGTPVAVRFSGA